MTNPYLEPVSLVWRRVAGIVLLVAAAGLTAVLGSGIFDFAAHAASGRTFTSSTLVFALILLTLCGICWQAGFRLAFDSGDGQRTLFSRPAWFHRRGTDLHNCADGCRHRLGAPADSP